MSCYVYILFSESRSRHYIGQTTDIDQRLLKHNNGQDTSTKNGAPWKLLHMIEVENRSEALILERKIKKRGAKRYLQDIGM